MCHDFIGPHVVYILHVGLPLVRIAVYVLCVGWLLVHMSFEIPLSRHKIQKHKAGAPRTRNTRVCPFSGLALSSFVALPSLLRLGTAD